MLLLRSRLQEGFYLFRIVGNELLKLLEREVGSTFHAEELVCIFKPIFFYRFGVGSEGRVRTFARARSAAEGQRAHENDGHKRSKPGHVPSGYHILAGSGPKKQRSLIQWLRAKDLALVHLATR